ncbi:MAG: sugar ABC transporter substrate-binding protein [Deltaproteobacteria bacterium]
MPRSNLRLFVIFPTESGIFFDTLREGMQKAAKELARHNVKIEFLETKSHNASRQLQILAHAIDLKPDGIVIIPASATQLNFLIDEATDNDIPVVTVADDAPYSKRLFYVGADNYACGRLCGELMGNFLCSDGNVIILSGSTELYTLKQRTAGFKDKLKTSFPNIKISKIISYDESEEDHFSPVIKKLSNLNDYNGIFVTSALGTLALTNAFDNIELPSPLKVIGFEPNQLTAKYLMQGNFSALIFQDSFMQGYLSLKILYDYLSHGIVPEKDCVNTRIEIVLRENIEKFI